MIKLLAFFFTLFLWAQDVPWPPSPVVDSAHLLSSKLKNSLHTTLHQVKQQYGVELAVITISKLQNETIETFAIKIADKWKLGSEKEDKGVILLLSLKDRKVRIEVGQGLEGQLTDLRSSRVIKGMTPYLKRKDYDNALLKGVDGIFTALNIKASSLEPPRADSNSMQARQIINIIIFIFFFIMMLRRGGRGPGAIATGMILGRSNRGIFGSGHSGGSALGGGFGGGSFGGGGGGFSGGGSSGGW